MKNIINTFNRWSPPDRSLTKSDQLQDFCHFFIESRFSLPVESAETREIRKAIAMVALDEYVEEVNFDGSPSLLALLGAIGTAERFVVDPQIVARKCQGLFTGDIHGRTLGGVGIVDIAQAFANGERRFQERRARFERLGF